MLRRFLLLFRRLLTALWNLLNHRNSEVTAEEAPRPPFDPKVFIFFNLPEVALRQVFNHLDSSFIFHFASLFPEFQYVLRQSKPINGTFRINHLDLWIELSRDDESAGICLETQSEQVYQRLKDAGKPETTINGLQYLYGSYNGHMNLVEQSVGSWEEGVNPKSLEWLCRLVIDWFNCESLVFKTNRRRPEWILPILAENKSKLRKLVIEGYSNESDPQIYSMKFVDCLRFLEIVKCEVLELEWRISYGQEKYSWKLSQREMVLKHATWLSIESLLTMECAELTASDVKLEASEIKTFVEKWMNGGLKQLELLELHGSLFISWNTVLHGLETCELNRRAEHRELDKFESLKEIRRSGGNKAVIALESSHFVMKVL